MSAIGAGGNVFSLASLEALVGTIGVGSGKHQEEALELALFVALTSSGFLVGQALPELASEELEPHPVHGPAHGSELLDDVLAIAAFLDHPDDPAELPMDPA
jgi:hypothetical protein